MSEELCFLSVFALAALAFCGLLAWSAQAAKRVALAVFSLCFLLVQWSMLSFRLGCDDPRIHSVSGLVYASPWALPLYVLCAMGIWLLFACLFIQPLRQAVLPRLGRRCILLCLIAIQPLQLALYSDAFCPIFGGELSMRFSLLVAGIVALLLVQQWAHERLRLRLESYSKRFKRSKPRPIVIPTAPAPRAAWRPSARQKRIVAICGAAFLMLLPLFFVEWREPKVFPPEVQRELDEIFHSEKIREHSDTFPPEEMADMYHEFTHSGDVNTRSDDWEWSMLHLSCWFRKPVLTQYLLERGADVNAATISKNGWASSQPFTSAVSNALHPETGTEMQIVQLLLDHGVDVDCRASGDNLMYSCAAYNENEEMFLLLLEHGADFRRTPVHPYTWIAAANGWPKSLRRLLEMGAPLTRYKEQALEGAARSAHRPHVLECARMLVEAGQNVNTPSGDLGYTALMALIDAREAKDEDTEALQRTGQMVLFFLECGAGLHDAWEVNEDASMYLFPDQARKEKRRRGKSIAEVLKEERPLLAQWLRERGVTL